MRGSALGLTVAKSLAKAHGGQLFAKSDGPGRGAAFIVEFPGCRSAAAGSFTSGN
ncbi:MAG: HAMP domain-containing histidine kinase [Chthoniobacterales bacterium]|nr:HAMP domain-containing histidine kinase [Chthoniobacterales bacterium]